MNDSDDNITCEGFGCSGKTIICIQICGSKKTENITLYLCKRCAKMFDDPLCSCNHCTHSNKKMLERTVRPECSNTSSSEIQQYGVLLND